jgi:DNA-binding MarR family transcriptional regulator
MPRQLREQDFVRLLDFRTGLRRFLRWSEEQAEAAGITAQQHQLMLAVRGHADPRGPTIGELSDYLLSRHHSVVGLVDRAEDAGLVQRVADPEDHRVVRVTLTRSGAEHLERLGAQHLEELSRMAPRMRELWGGLSV